MVRPRKQVLIELDDETASRLEKVAPAGSGRRSEFVRAAIGKALGEAEEQRTREAYARQPDAIDDVFVDPRVRESPATYPKKRTRS